MKTQKRKRVSDKRLSPESSSSSSSEDEDGGIMLESTVGGGSEMGEKVETNEAEFVFLQMSEQHWFGCKTLLGSNVLHGPHSSALAEVIVGQVAVGTLLGNCDSDIFALASVINIDDVNLTRITGVNSVIKAVVGAAPTTVKSRVEELFSGGGKRGREVGWYVSERFVNTPLTLVASLLETLSDDLDWAVENAEGDGCNGKTEAQMYEFENLFFLAPIVTDDEKKEVLKNFEDDVLVRNSEYSYKVQIGSKPFMFACISMKKFKTSLKGLARSWSSST